MLCLCVLCITLVIQGDVIWPNFGHSTTLNVWERIGEKHLAPSFIACGRGCVILIFSPNLARDVS